MRSAARADALDRLLMMVARLAGLVTIAALAYLLYALFSPAQYLVAAGRFTAAEQWSILRKVHWACQALATGVVLLHFSLVYRSRAFPEVGYAQGLSGAALLFGGPWLVEVALGGAQPSPAASEIVRTFRALGAIGLGAGLIYTVLDAIERLGPRRARKRTEGAILTSPRGVRESIPLDKPRDWFLGKCWNLPSCRPAVRPFCPIFLAHTGPCWRRGVGCMCQEEVLLIAARNEGFDVEGRSASGSQKILVLPTIDEVAAKLTRKQKSERCGKCVIYMRHQEQKYRLSVWLALAGVTAAVIYWRPTWHRFYVDAAVATERITRVLSLPTTPTKPEEQHPFLVPWVGRLAESSAVEWVFILCVAALALIYLLRAAEFLLYRLRW